MTNKNYIETATVEAKPLVDGSMEWPDKSEKNCRHEIVRKAGFHLGDNHPTLKDQYCMICGKTVENMLFEVREDERRKIIKEIFEDLIVNGLSFDELEDKYL